ncbi:MAG: MbnP family protein [Janthinobacterium lividum]
MVALLLTSVALLGSCKKTPDSPPAVGTVSFAIDNMAGAKDVALDGTAYTTASGETFTVSTLRYYISNIKLLKSNGGSYAAPNSYFLIDADKPSSARFTLGNVPVGDYTGASFLIGVDSTATKADPLQLTGDLNPANNMYWVWSTGHIFMKLEGTVTSTTPNKALICHVGGYRAPYSASVTATPSFNGTTLQVRADHTPQLHYSADILKIFDGPTKFTLSNFPTTMMPSAASVQVATNYAAGMFTVKNIQAN